MNLWDKCVQLRIVSEQRANEGTEGPRDASEHTAFDSNQGPGGSASALQWIALERLMNLMDKHVDIKI